MTVLREIVQDMVLPWSMLQIADSQDLIGPAQPIEELIEEYAKEDQIYRQKLQVDTLVLFPHVYYILFMFFSIISHF